MMINTNSNNLLTISGCKVFEQASREIPKIWAARNNVDADPVSDINPHPLKKQKHFSLTKVLMLIVKNHYKKYFGKTINLIWNW